MAPSWLGRPTLGAALALVTIVAACSGSAAPATTRTEPSSAGSAVGSKSAESTMPFTITSTAFDEGAAIPKKFSCDGENVSPALAWEGVPDGAASLALIVDDPDANGFVHWVVFDMTASQTGALAEAVSASPDAPPQGTNGRGGIGWTGPCPPSGTHRYNFTLYALDGDLGLTGSPSADDVRQAAAGHIVGEAVLNGTFSRG
ncbi:MAG TPA: YbhB/YbcL family Raf kinase inhibitor-like protein [Candidatus Limnocylindrales bacterium]|nr:YbhB/YbcL family Raf kinase inhibitor-like protein [Candidatus Limnocylindrales bacterium]